MLDKNKILKLYLEGHTTREVATLVGSSKSTVGKCDIQYFEYKFLKEQI